jgi:TRAP-type C4-dicarboxylate transport system substrate-binding protein
MATVAPDGTSWAREIRAFARDLEIQTKGEVRVKWFFGGIAGDDVEVGERIERGQLDGAASGGMLCQKLAPTMKVMRIQGVFQSRDEGAFVLSRLSTTLEEEFKRSGNVLLTLSGLGPEVVFTRRPIHTMDELRKMPLWRWNIDEIGLLSARELGESVVPLSLDEAARAYDEKRTDGFYAIPSAALAFQWFSRSLYLTDLHTSYLWGCAFITARAFDRLPIEHQKVLRAAGAKLSQRIEEIGRQQDEALLGGLFEKQGVLRNPVTTELRNDFLTAARAARQRIGGRLVTDVILQRVLALLADYRAEHRTK